MREIRAGERIDIRDGSHDLRIAAGNATAFAEVSAVVVPLGADDRLLPGFGPMIASARELRPGITFRPGHGVALDLAALPAEVCRLTIVLYVLDGAGGGTDLGALDELTLEIDGEFRLRLPMAGRREAALILAEVYRRGGRWRLAANGQGFAAGIAGVNRALGVDLHVPDAVPARRSDDDRGYGDPGERRPPPGATSSGSGFAVAPRLVVTNFHVIDHAVTITAAGELSNGPATIIAADPVNDIALIGLDHDARGVARFRPDLDIDLGEDVVVCGFPLQGLLGQGPQVSAGNISALTGIRGDSSQVQFNSPIGSGSSGGPMIDGSGLVVGLVRAVLRHDLDGGSVAQNINFGVKGALVRSFLHAAGVTPLMGPANAARSRPRAEIAREARGYLYRIGITH